MGKIEIKSTKRAEIDRVNGTKKSWALFGSNSLAEAAHKAKELGWKDKLVQVRVEKVYQDMDTYFVEPFERDCSCPNILKYSDFFD